MNKLRRTLKREIILTFFLVTYSIQGDWTLDELPERLELSEGEKFKVNFNTSLESYSRVNLDRVPKYGNFVLSYGNTENSDYYSSPKMCKSVRNLTQVGKTSLAFFCTNELDDEEYLIKFSSESKFGVNFRSVKLDIIAEKGDDCDRIIPLYDDSRFLLCCYNKKNDDLKFYDIRDDEYLSRDLVKKYKKEIYRLSQKFNYENTTILSTKLEIAKITDDKLYGIHLIEGKIEEIPQNSSKKNEGKFRQEIKKNFIFKISTLLYTKSIRYVSPFMMMIYSSEVKEKRKWFIGMKINQIITDGRLIIICGLEKNFMDFYQVKLLTLEFNEHKKHEIVGYVIPSITTKGESKLENHVRILNSQLINFPPLISKFSKMVDMKKYFVIGIFQPKVYKINLSFYKKTGVIEEVKLMDINRVNFLTKNVQTIEKFDLYEDRFLVRYIDKEGKRRLSRWDFMIEKDLDTYPMVEEGEVDPSVHDVLFMEDANVNFNFPSPRKRLLYKTMVRIKNRGDMIIQLYSPPAFEINYEIKNNLNFPPKLKADFHIRSYNEGDDRWKKREFNLNVTQYGGILELENKDGFRVDCYGKGSVVLHLPEILKGINSRISIDLYPKNSGISVYHLKGNELRFYGINFSVLENLIVLNDKFFLTKYKGENILRLHHCFPIPKQGFWSCFELKKWKKEKKFKILGSGYDPLRERCYLAIKIRREYTFCFWSFGTKAYSMLFREHCITDLKFKEGKFATDSTSKFWFLAYDSEFVPFKSKSNLYVWNFHTFNRFGPVKLKNDGQKEFSLEKLSSISSGSSLYYEVIFHVVILTPDVTIFRVDLRENEQKEVVGTVSYQYPVKTNSEFSAEIIQNKYLTIFEKVIGDSEDENKILATSSKLRIRKVSKLLVNIDQFQILSDLNEVYFGKIFKKIMNFKIQCDLGKKRNCVGFFIGKKTTDPDRKDDFALSVLNLNYEEEASNRLIGIYNLTGNFKIKKIIYNMDLEMYLIQLKNIDYENFIFFYVMENKTPFVRFGFSNIEQGRSEGQIMISTNYSNYLNNKNTYLENGLIHIHKANNSFQYKIPKEKIDLKIFKKKIKYFLLDDILNLEGWVKELKLEGGEEGKGEIIQRLEKKEKGSMGKCIEEFFENGGIISNLLKVKKGKKTSSVVYRSITNLLLVTLISFKNNKCISKAFYLYNGKLVTMKKYFLKGQEFPNFILVKKLIFNGNVQAVYFEIYNFYYDEKSGYYLEDRISTTANIRQKNLEFDLISANENNNSFVMFVSNPDGETKDSLIAITFKIDQKDQSILKPKIFDFKNSKNNPNDHVIGKIDLIKSTAVGNNIFLLSRTKYKNKLLISYFKTTEGEKEVELEHQRSQYYYLYFSKNDHRVLGELGLSLSQIAIKPNITNMKVELVLVSPLYHSFVFELNFNNFMRIIKGDADILKDPLVAIHKLKNPYNGISDFMIKRIDFVKNYIQVRYICENLEFGLTNKVIVYELPHQDTGFKRNSIVPILRQTYKTTSIFTTMDVSDETPSLYMISGGKSQKAFKILNYEFYKLNSKFKLLINGEGEGLKNSRVVIYGYSGEKKFINLEKIIFFKKPKRILFYICIGILILGFFLVLIVIRIRQEREEKIETSIESCSLNSDMNSSTIYSSWSLE